MLNRTRWLVSAVLLFGFASSAHAGGLTFVEAETDGAGGVDGIHAATGVATSPDGAHVYVTGRSDNALAVFSRNGVTSALTFVERQQEGSGGVTGLGLPSGVAISPDGLHVYVSSELDSAVAVFSRNAGTGALTFVEAQTDGVGGVDGIHTATAVACSPDGAHVYVTGLDDDGVAVFSRNAGTGALTFVEAKRDGVGGVTDLRRPRGVVVSPDGAHVYIAAQGSNAVTVFSRNAGTGALTFVEFKKDGDGNINGLRRTVGVTVSPDGASVYLVSADENAIASFSRNPGTGALTFIDVTQAGDAKGLKGPTGIAVSPNGRYVYASASISGETVVLRRDATTGLLNYLETVDPNVIDGASAVAATADGLSLYVAARDDNTVAAFAVDQCGNGQLGTDEQCDDGNVVSSDGCSSACRLELCGAAPAVGCRPSQSGASSVSLRDKTRNKSDKLQWKYKNGAATTLAELGDPTTSTSYLLCVYDAAGGPQPRLALAAPAGSVCSGRPCWDASSSGYRYKDALLTPDGLSTASLRSDTDLFGTSFTFSGKGGNLFLPPGLPFVPPLVIQLSNSTTGVCWQTTFSTVTTSTTSSSTKLKARND